MVRIWACGCCDTEWPIFSLAEICSSPGKSLPLHLEARTSVIGFRVLPFFVSNSENKHESRVQVRSLGDADSKVLSSDSVVVNVTSIGGERGKGLVKLVEETVRFEHALSPHKPIYLVGDSFGGCLALAVASRNPAIDLVLILSNPGDSVKVAAVNIESSFPPGQRFERLSCSLTGLLPYLSGFDDIIPRDALLWKLKLLKSAAAYANSRLHTVKAEVLVLASGKDNMLSSRDEAERLKNSLQDCVVPHFKDNGHTLLLVESQVY
ncbi:phytyl ester synthase 1, chloroplastic-like [Castanea sativa]|uniref:phytyl ester synthase 1, chloroplastic-like n=1 Tax=Castanea sativa TaxID=21020 RepID=UPI003F64BB04